MTDSGVFKCAPRYSVLFVDCDRDTPSVCRGMASDAFDIEMATCGYDALLLANVFVPDLVVLDLCLSDMNGLNLVRMLRGGKRTRGIAFLVVSSDTSRVAKAAAYASGCAAFLGRPCAVEDIFRAICALLAEIRPLEADGLLPGPPTRPGLAPVARTGLSRLRLCRPPEDEKAQ